MTPQPPHMCQICHQVFATSMGNAEHRGFVPRRCLTADELVAAGMRKDRMGVWKRLRR